MSVTPSSSSNKSGSRPTSTVTTSTRPIRRGRKALFRCVAVSFALLFAMVFGELALRVGGYDPTYVNPLGSFHQADPVSGHRGKPNFRGRFHREGFDVAVEHDERGFRKAEHLNPATAPNRLYVFGDSFTWGWGVGQGEVFTDRMSLQMPDWRIENFGINATGTAAQHALFTAECLPKLTAGDTVLVMFFFNDFLDNLLGSRPADVRDGQVVLLPGKSDLRPSWSRSLKQSSYLLNYLTYTSNVLKAVVAQRLREDEAEAAAQARSLAEAQNATDETSREMIVARHFLSQWKQDCAARGARLVVAYIPRYPDVDAVTPGQRQTELAYRRSFELCTKAVGVETIDLSPPLRAAAQASPQEPLSLKNDDHWTARGHQVAAEALRDRMNAAVATRPTSAASR